MKVILLVRVSIIDNKKFPDGAIAMIQALGMYLDTLHYANEIITI